MEFNTPMTASQTQPVWITVSVPKDAAPGTIRRDFASSKGENIVHGSDSPENGKLEIAFFFSEKELIQNG